VNIEDDPRQAELRDRFRRWLLEHGPVDVDTDDDELRNHQLRGWQATLHAAGWMGLAWPVAYGGQGGSLVDQAVFNQEIARAKAPSPPGIIGLQTLGPTLLEHGTEVQRQRFLPAILDAREVWCQGFSEPGAGSDLAALRTSAVRTGENYVVNGQKVWTSYAQFADWCALLVRTGAPDSRHRGLTYLLVDMRTPGITVRPIRQIDGNAEFNEVFFDDVHVPVANVVGEPDKGWKVALGTLEHERATYVLSRSVELRIALDDLAAQTGAGADDADLVDLGTAAELMVVLEAQSFSTMTRLSAGAPGPLSAVDKLLTSEIEQAVFGTGLRRLGPAAAGAAGPDASLDSERWARGYLTSRSATIHGGTAQILRNTIAQRLLGLPRS
jgi:alkylation response protein AidB-like acyl-CoA dehydrogenase